MTLLITTIEFRIEDFRDYEESIALIIVLGRRRRFKTSGEKVGEGGFKLCDVEYRVDAREIVGESKCEGVIAVLSSDFKGPNAFVGELSGQPSGQNVLRFDKDTVSNTNDRRGRLRSVAAWYHVWASSICSRSTV